MNAESLGAGGTGADTPTSRTALPNFFILGAAKAGTTALAAYLAQHPQIFMSPTKEPHFFTLVDENPTFVNAGDAKRAVTRWDDYIELFQGRRNETAIGEASTTYLHSAKAANGLHARFPDARLIAVLRQPIERAYSAFVMYRRDNREVHDDLLQAIEHEQEAKHYHGESGVYLARSYYFEPLKQYIELFGRENIQVHLYEDFRRQPQQMLDKLCSHIGVDTFRPDMSTSHNVGGLHKSGTVKQLLTRPNPLRFLARTLLPESVRIKGRERIKRLSLRNAPPLDAEIWTHLLDKYREDILRLQDLIDRDLGHWLRPEP